MTFYKFMHFVHRHFFTDQPATLMFRNLSFFRLQEIAERDCWIGDGQEGLAENFISGVALNSSTSEFDRSNLRDVSLEFQAGNVTIGQLTSHQTVHGYAFCFSCGEIQTLVEYMCGEDRKQYAYNGCVNVSDPQLLAHRIKCRGRVNGVPVADQFHVKVGPAIYEDVVGTTISDLVTPNPFRKRGRYQEQREWRILLLPYNEKEMTAPDAVFVSLSPNGIFSPVELDIDTVPEASPSISEQLALQYLLKTLKRNENEIAAARSDLLAAYWRLRHLQPYCDADQLPRIKSWLVDRAFQNDHPPGILRDALCKSLHEVGLSHAGN